MLFRLLQRFVGPRSWATPTVVIVFVFFTSWPLMALFESADSELVRPANYWWWFLVTTSTVGYGDFYPETTGGHTVGVYVIVGGIATLTTLFTHLATKLETARGKRMSGTATLHVSGHVLMLGYHSGRSERILDELLADGRHPVVLAAWDEVDRNPVPDRGIGFVRGDVSTDEVLRRAGVQRARSVLIDAHDDNEALAIAVTVDHVSPELAPVVALRDMSRAEHLRYVNSSIRCVQWHTPQMITEELLDPGITQVYAELVTHGGGEHLLVPAARLARTGDLRRVPGRSGQALRRNGTGRTHPERPVGQPGMGNPATRGQHAVLHRQATGLPGQDRPRDPRGGEGVTTSLRPLPAVGAALPARRNPSSNDPLLRS
ncbi:ion channel [Actinopolyspora halophila]|uniref:ion channel n=1 Tax=Actinopolyspora halophila TaxID=1850 RepID=UPI001FE09FC3|nr:NAD-binding protein [Actinopolyspora halophila]